MKRSLSLTLMMLGPMALLGACGSSSNDDGGADASGGQGGSNADASDAAGGSDGGDAGGDAAAPHPFMFVVVYDRETISCGATNGPGADIDAVELKSAGATVGYGKSGSALFGVGMKPCADADCSGGACKYSCTKDGAGSNCPLAANAEGKPDAVVYKSKSDTGYISLNTGSLQVQIGDTTGAGSAKEIKKGDTIKVYEVDQTDAGDMTHDPDNVCKCLPEKYEVYIFRDDGTGKPDATASVKLTAGDPDSANATMCAAMSMGAGEGCGTTTFTVP